MPLPAIFQLGFQMTLRTRPLIGRKYYPISINLKTLLAIFHRRCLHIVFMNSAAIRELKLNDKNVEFPDNMKIVRRSDGTGKFEKRVFCWPNIFKISRSKSLNFYFSNISEWITPRGIWIYQGLGSYWLIRLEPPSLIGQWKEPIIVLETKIWVADTSKAIYFIWTWHL